MPIGSDRSDLRRVRNVVRLSSLADYAVVMLAAAARHPGAARLSAGCLADETGVPLPTAQKLMGRLAAAGLLSSARGTGGGFVLAKSPETISLADIIEAVEGPIGLTACVDDHRHDCALEGNCRVRPHWGVVNEAIRGALAGVSLARLASNPVRAEPVEALPFSLTKSQDSASRSSARTGVRVEGVA